MRRFLAIALSSTFMLQAAPLMAATAMGGTRAAVQASVATGTINGIAQTSTGQILANYTVRARNLDTGQVAGTTMSNAAGSFTFAGLSPANYIIEVVNQTGSMVGSSASITVTAGATASVTVSATATAAGAAVGAAASHGISTAVFVTTAAAAAGIAGVVVAVKNNASPSR